MKRSLPVLAVALLFAFAVGAQTVNHDYLHCGSDARNRQLIERSPAAQAEQAKLEKFTQEYVATHTANERSTYIIPIVFHIIHEYGPENISDAQVIDAVRVINEDYSKTNADTASTIAGFKTIASSSDIEFRLARKDPNGNCTNGIDRIESPLTYMGDDNAKLNPWNHHNYLNVWVVNTMADAGVAGYSYYPGGANASADGVIILYDYIGAIGSGSVAKSHALSHEIGHFLNLKHPWGDTNSPGVACGDDNVNDTPETKGWTSCNLGGAVCNAGVIENVQNFMDYSYCSTMFTAGQGTRMHAALNASTSGRNHLWIASNLTATGTDNLNYAACAPQPVIIPVSQQFVCAGDSVHFTNMTLEGTATTWNWQFTGGNPTTSSLSTPTVTYASAGNYNVSLTVGNATGSNIATQNNYVTVLPATGQVQASGFFENFESLTFPGNNWTTTTIGSTDWSRVTTTGYSGTASLRLEGFSMASGQKASFVSPTYDFSSISSPKLYFRVSHALQASTDVDALKIYVSRDCGKTWTLRYSKSGSSLSTTTATGNYFIPASQSQWRQDMVNLTAYAGEPNVRLRFEYTGGGGNNIYIDDLNFNQPTGVGDLSEGVAALSVFPNPSADGAFAVSFNMNAAHPTVVKLVSAEGRETVLAQYARLEAGHQLLAFDTRALPSGYYTLWIQAGDEAYSRALIIKR